MKNNQLTANTSKQGTPNQVIKFEENLHEIIDNMMEGATNQILEQEGTQQQPAFGQPVVQPAQEPNPYTPYPQGSRLDQMFAKAKAEIAALHMTHQEDKCVDYVELLGA